MTDLGVHDPDGVYLDNDHAYSLCVDRRGREVGLLEYHRKPEGGWCSGFVAFTGHGDGSPEWTVVLQDPLTLTPSILCRSCGAHGWIEGGRWRNA